MCSQLVFRCLTFAAGCCLALIGQAQTATVTAVPSADTTVHFVPATLFKLGTGLTRGLNIGGHLGFSLPIVAGLERQYKTDWSAYGNVSSGWRIGSREQATSAWDQPSALVSELGVDIGLRHYYRQAQRRAAGRAAGLFAGNYVALQASGSFIPAYSPSSRLYRDYYGATLLWGAQRRLGKHGLLDAHVGGGLHHRLQGLTRNDWQLQPALELGVKLSLVR